jgi:hypothetical protein
MRVAQRAGDVEGARLAERIAREERTAAALRAQFEPAMEAALRKQGVGAAGWKLLARRCP